MERRWQAPPARAPEVAAGAEAEAEEGAGTGEPREHGGIAEEPQGGSPSEEDKQQEEERPAKRPSHGRHLCCRGTGRRGAP